LRDEPTMSNKEQLIAEIDTLPEPLVQEVLDFVEFLRTKIAGDSTELAVASESSLKKDWLRPEEEAAWQDL
jgi:Protein of unknown function (DUF2281)